MSETPRLGKRFVAELVGTFVFVFVGAGSALATKSLGITDPGSALLIAALANGIGLGTAISITLAISGGALNPAVTVGLLVGGKLPARDVIPYIVAELVGATIAGGVLVAVAPSSLGSAVHYGSPTLGANISALQGMLFELVMTFFLVLAVYGTIVDSRAPKIAGFGVGLAVLTDVLAGGPFTGAAMNPARAMGPMIAGLFFPSYWYVYWVGPLLGGILAGLVYHYVLEKN
ncbi:MAG: aquaporin [Thaumarchaeota archaeon]|nr:aquaporin [Nitrososphaerota archaeon]MCL5067857.1 aquaporin [Nitrososphaerota archaeon]